MGNNLATRLLTTLTNTGRGEHYRKTAKQTEEVGDKERREKKRKTYFYICYFEPLVKKRALSHLPLVPQPAER